MAHDEGGPIRAIVIDDEPMMRRILSNLLRQSFRAQVREAENGELGLAAIVEDLPDIALVDMSMPVMDGWSMVEEVRKGEATANLPVVAVSARADRETVQRMIDLGVADYLVKPIVPRVAERRLRAVLRRTGLLQAN